MVKKKQSKAASDEKQINFLDKLENKAIESILPSARESESKYPKLLTIVPLFAASDRERYSTDQNKGQVYNAPEGGRIRRIGPGIDMYDEDTLIAILQLGSEKKIVGRREAMPLALPPADNQNEITVYKGDVSAASINNFLGRGEGGIDLDLTRSSIRRLANQRLWFENMETGEDGLEGVTDFFKYSGRTDLKGKILIQVSPEMVNLLKYYESVDMTIRRELNDCGKAVYRFLLSQPKEYAIKLEDLAEAICYDAGGAELKRTLLGRKATARTKARPNQLELMINLGFLEQAEITGTGRRTPVTLHVVKAETKTKPSIEEKNKAEIITVS